VTVLAFIRAHSRATLVVLIMVIAALWLADHDAQIRKAQQLSDQKAEFAVEAKSLQARVNTSLAAAKAQQSQADALAKQAAEQTAQIQNLETALAKRQAAIKTAPVAQVHNEVITALGPDSEASGSTPSPLPLSEVGMRAVDMVIAQRNGCQQQLAQSASLAATLSQEASTQKGQIGSYQDALKSKDELIAAAQQEAQQEIKIAKGTWLQRLTHNAKWFAAGAAAGAIAMGAAR
jgi:hypothetical protein